MVNIHSIGGYSEIGKNMTALQLKDDVLLLDCGLYMPPLVELEEDKNREMNEKVLRSINALPEDDYLLSLGLQSKVRAIIASHAHLDHVGAIPYVAGRYNADIVATPYSLEIVNSIMKSENITLPNKFVPIQPNSSYTVRGKREYEVELLNITHSVPQSTLIIVHTDEGAIVYANDFKFDNTPVIGKKPDYARLRQLGKEGVLALVVESLYSAEERKTPSEKIARGLLEDVLFTTDNENACIIATTFSSHIARLKSLIEFGTQMGRKIVLVGRSLGRYTDAAKKLELAPFMKGIPVLTYRNQIESAFRKIAKNRKEYMVICTGHQGEPGSILDRLSKGAFPFTFDKHDQVIFSSRTIPSPINIANKIQLTKRLHKKGVRIFNDVHVSGHAAKEDLRDFINLLQPRNVIPSHGDLKKLTEFTELATEMGYKLGRDCHILQDKQNLELKG